MSTIHIIENDKLSHYRTHHLFKNYSAFETLEDYKSHLVWAKTNKVRVYILGNGSNTFFVRREVRSLVLKNELPKQINTLPDGTVSVSSTLPIISLLKYCLERSQDSFYYLSSVPATVGGALAMNAGRGRKHNVSIYDFVESVTFYDCKHDSLRTLGRSEIVKGYRETIFSGVQSKLIVSAVFRFPKSEYIGNPIAERCRWSKENQDYSGANCGSVFKQFDFRLMQKLEGLSLGKGKFSERSINWITNYSKNPRTILVLIWLAKLLHCLRGKRAELEIILVD